MREKRSFGKIDISIHAFEEFLSSKYYGILLILAHHIDQKNKQVFLLNRKDSYPLVFHLKLNFRVILHMFFSTAKVRFEIICIFPVMAFYDSKETVMKHFAGRELPRAIS